MDSKHYSRELRHTQVKLYRPLEAGLSKNEEILCHVDHWWILTRSLLMWWRQHQWIHLHIETFLNCISSKGRGFCAAACPRKNGPSKYDGVVFKILGKHHWI